jgi:acyl dehydratase
MTAFDRLTIGARFVTPSRTVSAEDASEIVRRAGYTHPLFASLASGATEPGAVIPGQLTLLLLGGLAEQTDAFDETTLALVSLDAVEFRSPARIGDRIRLEMEVIDKSLSPGGRRGFATFAWACADEAGRVVLTARATFAFRIAAEPMAP